MQVRSLGWEDSLEEGMATHSSILAWRIPINRSAWRVMAHEVAESHTAEQLTTTTAQRMGVPAGTSGKEPACQFRRRKRRRFSL